MIRFIELPQQPVELFRTTDGVERYHKFDQRSIDAINAALGAGRPLLVRGEPGVGKTQLAEAAARELKRAFVRRVVDSRTESRDLLYNFDAVARLAEAQLCNACGNNPAEARKKLAIHRFVIPGPLWWAFDFVGAEEHCAAGEISLADSPLLQGKNKELATNGWVVLIDEIDKAESDVPNGLLEALGAGEFTPPDCGASVKMSKDTPAPLIVITTNEERILPDAFVRRCAVLHLALPKQKDALKTTLREVGAAHFGSQTSNDVLETAAEQLANDRHEAIDRMLKPLPGQAEYLDMLRAVIRRHPGEHEKQKSLLDKVAQYIVKKPVEMQVVG